MGGRGSRNSFRKEFTMTQIETPKGADEPCVVKLPEEKERVWVRVPSGEHRYHSWPQNGIFQDLLFMASKRGKDVPYDIDG